MSRTGSEFMYTNVIISSSLKPYQIFGPDLSPGCLLMFSVVLPPVVIHDQRDRQFQTDHGYSIRSRASCPWPEYCFSGAKKQNTKSIYNKNETK